MSSWGSQNMRALGRAGSSTEVFEAYRACGAWLRGEGDLPRGIRSFLVRSSSRTWHVLDPVFVGPCGGSVKTSCGLWLKNQKGLKVVPGLRPHEAYAQKLCGDCDWPAILPETSAC